MIKGIGTDLVKLSRVEQSLSRFGDRFAQRVLTEDEMADFQQSSKPVAFLAKRWAAKEAAAKALGTGIGAKAGFQDMYIEHDDLGAPLLRLTGVASETASEKGVLHTYISLSDEDDHALAFVILSS